MGWGTAPYFPEGSLSYSSAELYHNLRLCQPHYTIREIFYEVNYVFDQDLANCWLVYFKCLSTIEMSKKLVHDTDCCVRGIKKPKKGVS